MNINTGIIKEPCIINNTAPLCRAHSRSAVKPDTVTYNTIINVYARSGDVEGTIKWFEAMVEAGLSPDEVTRPLPSHESVHQDRRLRAPG